jgi:hypothetical protein
LQHNGNLQAIDITGSDTSSGAKEQQKTRIYRALLAANMTRIYYCGISRLGHCKRIVVGSQQCSHGEKAVLKGRYYGVTGVLTYYFALQYLFKKDIAWKEHI